MINERSSILTAANARFDRGRSQLNIVCTNLSACGQSNRTFQDVFELAHVAWKGVYFQRGKCVLAEHRRRNLHASSQSPQYCFCEFWDVFRTFAQRRNSQLDDIHAIE